MRSIVVVHPGWHDTHGAHGAAHSYRTYEQVVRAVTGVSPLVEVEEPGRLVFSARGPSRYFGGEQAVVDAVQSSVAGTGLGDFGVGVAGSRFAACAAAWSVVGGRPLIVGRHDTASFLSGLPVGALHGLAGVPAAVTGLFDRLGLHTCGAVASLGEKALIERFGLEGRHVHRLVTGRDERMLDPGAPPPDIVRAVDFDSPLVSVRAVTASSRACIEDALQAVSATGRQCVRVLLACETDSADTNERIWTEPRGFDPAAVMQRLAWQIDGWLVAPDHDPAADAVSSGVIRVVITPLECRDVLVDQPLLWGGNRENAERAARAVSLAVATGAARSVTVPQWSGGRDVSGEYERVPVDMVDLGDAHAAEQRVRRGRDVPRQWRGVLPSPSPAVVHPAPLHVEVLDRNGEQVVVTGRHELSAAPRRVTAGRDRFVVLAHAGPWPVEERWWDPARRRRMARVQALVRDERTGTERVLLLVLEAGRWALLARYD